MNERIKELEARAKNRSQYLLAILCNKTNRTSDEITEAEKQEVFNETFASLIIQECIDIVENINQEHDGGSTTVNAAEEIAEYFGV